MQHHTACGIFYACRELVCFFYSKAITGAGLGLAGDPLRGNILQKVMSKQTTPSEGDVQWLDSASQAALVQCTNMLGDCRPPREVQCLNPTGVWVARIIIGRSGVLYEYPRSLYRRRSPNRYLWRLEAVYRSGSGMYGRSYVERVLR